MTSDETHDNTLELLRRHDNFGLASDQLIILRQGLVPAMRDNTGAFVLSDEDPYRLESKPHGHGDMHRLLYRHGLVDAWVAEGRTHTVFIQDTNGQVFNGILPALGVSRARGFEFNFMTVPREAKEQAGVIIRRRRHDGTSITGNVEYNLLDPFLRATINPQGDAPDPTTGLSVYPGNTNAFIIRNDAYQRILRDTRGLVQEFVNPKYADATRTTFTSPARLETMMQDAALWFSTVGATHFEKRHVFSPVKNNLVTGARNPANGLYPDAMPTGEADFHKHFRRLLQRAEVQINVEGNPATARGVPYQAGAKVVLRPRFAQTVREIIEKIKGGSITDRSTLIIDGEHVVLENLQLDGALIIRTAPDVTLTIRNATVTNAGWHFVELTDEEIRDPTVSSELKVRGYRLDKRGERVIELSEPGDYELSMDGVLRPTTQTQRQARVEQQLRIAPAQAKSPAPMALMTILLGGGWLGLALLGMDLSWWPSGLLGGSTTAFGLWTIVEMIRHSRAMRLGRTVTKEEFAVRLAAAVEQGLLPADTCLACIKPVSRGEALPQGERLRPFQAAKQIGAETYVRVELAYSTPELARVIRHELSHKAHPIHGPPAVVWPLVWLASELSASLHEWRHPLFQSVVPPGTSTPSPAAREAIGQSASLPSERVFSGLAEQPLPPLTAEVNQWIRSAQHGSLRQQATALRALSTLHDVRLQSLYLQALRHPNPLIVYLAAKGLRHPFYAEAVHAVASELADRLSDSTDSLTSRALAMELAKALSVLMDQRTRLDISRRPPVNADHARFLVWAVALSPQPGATDALQGLSERFPADSLERREVAQALAWRQKRLALETQHPAPRKRPRAVERWRTLEALARDSGVQTVFLDLDHTVMNRRSTVEQFHRYEPVEPDTAAVLGAWRVRGIRVVGLTDRWPEMDETTRHGLAIAGIELPEIVYARCEGACKAVALGQFFEQHPEIAGQGRWMFVDDSLTNLQNVRAAYPSMEAIQYLGVQPNVDRTITDITQGLAHEPSWHVWRERFDAVRRLAEEYPKDFEWSAVGFVRNADVDHVLLIPVPRRLSAEGQQIFARYIAGVVNNYLVSVGAHGVRVRSSLAALVNEEIAARYPQLDELLKDYYLGYWEGVRQVDDLSIGGPARRLQPSPRRIRPIGRVIGLNIGQSDLKMVVLDSGQVVAGSQRLLPQCRGSPAPAGPEINQIAQAIETLQAEFFDASHPLRAIGIAVPGVLRHHRIVTKSAQRVGRVEEQFQAFQRMDVLLQERFGVPVVLEQDVRSRAVALSQQDGTP